MQIIKIKLIKNTLKITYWALDIYTTKRSFTKFKRHAFGHLAKYKEVNKSCFLTYEDT